MTERQGWTPDISIVERLERIKAFMLQTKAMFRIGFSEYTTEYDGVIDTLSEAVALLVAQKPRVLTADEMEDAGRNGDPVYVETACGGCFWALAIPGEEPPKDKPFNYPGGVRFNVREADGDIHDGDFYGMTTPDGKAHCLAWRAWTDKPTREQMKAEPWA